MSDPLSLAHERFARLRRRPGRPGRLRTLTPAQEDLRRNFIPAAQAAEEEERSRIKPLQFIFHLLQTGQFVTANVAQELINSVKTGDPVSDEASGQFAKLVEAVFSGNLPEAIVRGAPKGIQAGLTGGARGNPLSWEDVFFEDTPKEERNIGQKAAGFAADVLLDPTTYLTFGATTVARGVASRFAWDSTKIFLKENFPKVLQDMGEEALKKTRNASKILGKMGDAQRRAVRDHYNDAFRRAMNSPGGRGGQAFEEGLQSELRERFGQLPLSTVVTKTRPRSAFLVDPEGVARAGKTVASRVEKGATAADEAMLGIRESIEEGFAGAGQRYARFMGIKVPGEAGRLLDLPMRKGREVFEAGRAAFSGTAIGGKFGDAWWALMNNSVVGELRKTFGFLRGPFDQMMHVRDRQWELGMHKAQRNHEMMVNQLREGLSEDQIAKINRVTRQADLARRKGDDVKAADLLEEFGDDPQARTALNALVDMMERARIAEDALADEKIIDEMGHALNYFPVHFTDELRARPAGAGPLGSFTPTPTFESTAGIEAIRKTNRDNLRWAFGDALEDYAVRVDKTPDQVLDDLIDNKGWGDAEMDFFDAAMIRMKVHERIMTRAKMVREFRELGIPLASLPEEARNMLGNQPVQQLREVGDPALKGFLFDKEIANIIERAYDVTATNQGQSAMKRFWSWQTRFFKAYATMTPRFHIRNHISNQMTGFLKHGLRWMSPFSQADGFIATWYALNKGDYVDFLTDYLKKPGSWIEGRLNRTVVGNRTLRQIAEEAEELGAIVPRGVFTREMQALEGAKQSRVIDNPLTRTSQKFGDLIENHARMTSFMLDYTDGFGVRDFAQNAAQESRKWFLDYDDLTPFEQNIMRNIIPFYTWMRKNIVNQMSGLVLHGNLYSVIPKANRLAQSAAGGILQGFTESRLVGANIPGQAGASVHDDDIDFQLLEDWEQQLSVFPVWADRLTGKALLFDPFFAYQDINRMIPLFWEEGKFMPTISGREILNDFMNAAHPAIKTVFELSSGRDMFRDRPLRDKQGESLQTFAPVAVNRAIVFLDGVMNISGFPEGLKIELKDDGSVLWDAEVHRAIDNNLPAIRTIGSVIEAVESVNAAVLEGQMGQIVESISQEKDYNSALLKMLRSIAFVFGAKFREFDEQTRREQRAEEIRQRAEEARSRERRQLPGQEQRSEERDRRRLLENQRLGLL